MCRHSSTTCTSSDAFTHILNSEDLVINITERAQTLRIALGHRSAPLLSIPRFKSL